MARKVTIEAFKVWIADEANLEDVLARIAGGLTLQKTSRAVKQPYTCLHEFFHSTPEREARYLGARKAWADAQMDEALEIADGVAPDRDHVAKAKLRVDIRHNQAKAYHRERWGEHIQVEKTVDVTVSSVLLGRARQLLNKIAAREPRVIEGVSLEREGELAPPPQSAKSE